VVGGIGFSLAFSAATAGSILLFRMLNRTRVHGLRNIPSRHDNVLYCLNHNSILDNFAFEVAAYIPKLLFRPRYLPISLADRKNFFGDPDSRKFKDQVLRLLGRHFFRHLKAYPVDRRSGDLEQVDQWIELLKENIVIVFPEGTRTRTGEIGPGKPGVGKLIHDARPTVIPVHMTGTGEVLGVGMRIPDVFKTIEVFIGEPMDLQPLLARPLPQERKEQLAFYAEISDAVLDVIRDLNPASRKEFSASPRYPGRNRSI
jgi:1-acyl-sn-glycerol-3-phosphate acyltransferase